MTGVFVQDAFQEKLGHTALKAACVNETADMSTQVEMN